jgi:hypothetical protein
MQKMFMRRVQLTASRMQSSADGMLNGTLADHA